MARHKTIRILHIVTYMGVGGLETMLMNVYRNIDRQKVQFDFLVHRQDRAKFDDEIETLGGRIYRLPRLNPFDPVYHCALRNFFREHPEYRIVHCHQDCLSSIPLTAAKKAGVPIRIAHSHTSNQDRNLKYLLKRYYMAKTPSVATHFFACSQEAGRWMFPGQQITIINNGIDTSRFAFSPEIRAEVRRELGLQEKFTVGHVGSFVPAKNHSFLLDVFKVIHTIRPDAVLLLAGNGPLEGQIRKKVKNLELEGAVRFLGLRDDVNRIYQAMDIFVLPSLFEGLGIVAVEAQTSGLPCVISDTVSRECMVAENLVSIMGLKDSAAVWAQHILSSSDAERHGRKDEVTRNGYDIQENAQWLESFYLSRNLE